MNYFLIFLLIFCFLEIILRLVILIKNRKFKFLAPPIDNFYKHFAYMEHPYIGYCKSKNVKNHKFPSNNHGFAGTKDFSKEKGEKIQRILVCGGSTVEQNDIDQKEPFDYELTWPKVFENILNQKDHKFEVLNAGCSGYTILENIIHLITKGIHFKPDYAILYASINDAWLIQAAENFKDDYSHARKHPKFPKNSKLISWIPNLRFLYIYQYSIIYFYRYFSPPNDLTNYSQVNNEIYHNYSKIDEAKKIFKDYLKTFCGVCISNKIVPILIPWQFNDSLINNKSLNIASGWSRDKFIKLLKMNNEAINETYLELNNVKLIDVGNLTDNCYRDEDFVHFSKYGLIKMGELVAKNFLNILKK